MSEQSKIHLQRIDDHVNFVATNSDGESIFMDGSPAIGGKGNGVRPMETLLMGLAGCSSIDVVLILKKMKQKIDNLEVEITADKVKKDHITSYTKINLHFILSGQIKEAKLKKAIQLSVEKYCSVSKILEKSSKITTSYIIK